MEARLFQAYTTPYVSTAEFHRERERAPHMEQEVHRGRLMRAADFVVDAIDGYEDEFGGKPTVTDLGCGDGGLLQEISRRKSADQSGMYRGYDFQPSNEQGWIDRQVTAELVDVFGDPHDVIHPSVILGDIVVMTEVLEHIHKPHNVLAYLHDTTTYFIVASSPRYEHAGSHDECHAWAWDMDGYAAMFREAGWSVRKHEGVGIFQVMMAQR